MPPLSPQAQALLTQFGKQPGVTPDQAANLQNVINGSPALVNEVNAAADFRTRTRSTARLQPCSYAEGLRRLLHGSGIGGEDGPRLHQRHRQPDC